MSRRVLISFYAREEDILGVTRDARQKGYTIDEVYTPYAVHGLDQAMELRPSRLPWVCLAFGLLGATAKLWFQIWTSATSWPVNVGGVSRWPRFLPLYP